MWSHPFIERFDWNHPSRMLGPVIILGGPDLELKLLSFRDYYNRYRTHSALKGQTPIKNPESKGVELKRYGWQTHCRGLHHPIAA
jgi:hypothetical protein